MELHTGKEAPARGDIADYPAAFAQEAELAEGPQYGDGCQIDLQRRLQRHGSSDRSN